MEFDGSRYVTKIIYGPNFAGHSGFADPKSSRALLLLQARLPRIRTLCTQLFTSAGPLLEQDSS